MGKINIKFVNYFLFGLLVLAFIAPITHSAYEGLENEGKEDDDEEEEGTA